VSRCRLVVRTRSLTSIPRFRSPEDDVIRLQDALDVISEDNLIATSLLLVSWASPDLDEEIAEAVGRVSFLLPSSLARSDGSSFSSSPARPRERRHPTFANRVRPPQRGRWGH
jgi:hypothetical protein